MLRRAGIRAACVPGGNIPQGWTNMFPVTFGAKNSPGYITGQIGRPAVIVLQEWWGVTDEIKDKAMRLSAEGGYRCLVPDLYKGKLAVEVEEAQHEMSSLDWPNAIQELVQAAEWLKSQGSPKVGITGFCMGGALTMAGLASSPVISCGAPFYGVNFQLFDAATLKKPVQGHFGELDNLAGFSDAATGRKLEADLRAGGNAEAEVFIYPGVGHAFMNTKPSPFTDFAARKEKMGFEPYQAEQAELAWSRMLAFFQKHLKA